MNDDERPDREPLVEGLAELPEGAFELPGLSSELRESLLARTSSVVRGRLVRRRLLRTAALVAIYVAGVASGRLYWTGDGPSPDSPGPVTAIGGGSLATVEKSPLPLHPRSLEEELIEADPQVKREAWKEAGDRYLSSSRADPQSALYCYQRLLAQGPNSEPEPEDSWLLKYLKIARR